MSVIKINRWLLPNFFTMGNLLYIFAVILLIGWLIGVIGYSVGGLIHILLVLAVIAILLRIIEGRKPLV